MEIPGAKISKIKIIGREVELFRAPFIGDYGVIVPCSNIADYKFSSRVDWVDAIDYFRPSLLERIIRRHNNLKSNSPIINFLIDNVVIEDVKESEYKTSSSDIFPLCGRAPITIRRMDYVFKDSTGKMLGYLELNASNRSPMWSTAVFSQQGDRTKIRVNMSSQQIPLCAEIIKIENYSLVERLLSKTPSYAGR